MILRDNDKAEIMAKGVVLDLGCSLRFVDHGFDAGFG